ncbi:MAG TPA: NUDIX domain-containing protein [Patescibacteria group bacterium]|nr:NUDIX domain-containing protein [Patescibacteria group bacterium]
MVRQYSAGGVVFKKEDGQTLWLLIQPARIATQSVAGEPAGKDEFHKRIRWQLPKGWINEGEKTEAAAIREVAEEGGVKAKIISKIDSIKIFFSNTFEGKPEEKILKTIAFYLMEYLGEKANGHDEEVAEVAWLPFEEAKGRLTFKSEKEVLTKAKEILENPLPQQALF